MNEAEYWVETRRWLRYAYEDLCAAEATLNVPGVRPRHACWLAQQAAEKALKAILVFLQIDFPYRHDLDVLRNLISDGWEVKTAYPDLAVLTEWAVEARYPGGWSEAVATDAGGAIAQARAIFETVRVDLARHGFAYDI